MLVEQRRGLLPTERRGCLLSRNLERNFAGARASRNGQAGLVFPVPTSPSIRTRQRPSPRRRVQCQSGARVSLVPCTPRRRAQPQAGKLPLERRRKAARSMAGHNHR